jgi:hypothetical protein
LGPKKITFSVNILKVFVPKTDRKRKNNGTKCPFQCFPRPMVTQTARNPVHWKARDRAFCPGKNKNWFFFKKKLKKKPTQKKTQGRGHVVET